MTLSNYQDFIYFFMNPFIDQSLSFLFLFFIISLKLAKHLKKIRNKDFSTNTQRRFPKKHIKNTNV